LVCRGRQLASRSRSAAQSAGGVFDQRETGGILTFASRVVLGQNGGTVDVELGSVPK
jgi:hypothetical protein